MTIQLNETEITIALIKILKDGNKDIFHKVINELRPYDVARQFTVLPVKHRPLFLNYLTVDELTELLRHLHQDQQIEVMNALGPDKASEVLGIMKNDDLAAMLIGLPAEQIDEFIEKMQQDEAHIIRKIMNYPPDTAGRIMTNRFVWIHEGYTVQRAMEKLRHFANIAEYLNYLYIIDDHKKLVGVVSYKDLLLATPNDKISDMRVNRIVKANVLTDQEDVANLFGRYDFVSLPVVEDDGKLVGIITVDDVLDVVKREADEDIEKLHATAKSIDFNTKPAIAAYRRLPWLIILLFIGLISGSIISSFEATLEEVVALAFFMPLIAGMTGNTGTQSLAVVVRGLVSEDLDLKRVIKLLIRELIVGIIIGVTCGVIVSLIAYVWQGSFTLGMIVGSSLLLTLIIGTFAGTVIPLILYRFKIDPAIASGPLITTINDILSLIIYFGIATMFLSKLT